MFELPFLVIATGLALLVLSVDQAVKHWVTQRRSMRMTLGPRMVLRRTLHAEGLLQRVLWRSTLGAAAVLFAILLGLGLAYEHFGDAASLSLLALSAGLGGATSNAFDLHHHGGVVNCVDVAMSARGSDRLALNPADLAIAGAVLVALLGVVIA